MNNNTSSGVPGATPAPDSPVMGSPASQSVTLEKPAATVEELQARLAELEHAHKNAVEERDRHRKKLSGYEEAEKKAQEDKLSEIERIKKQHTELQAQHDAYVQQSQARLVRYEIERQATKLGVIDPDAAAKLLDWSELEYDEHGAPINTTKLLEKLLKSKPYLAPTPQPSTQPSSETETPTRRAAPALPAMQPGRTTISAPGTQPPGRIPRLGDPGVLVPPGTPSKYQP